MKSVAVLTFVHWANPSFWYLIWIDAILEEPPLVTTRNAALGPGALFSGLLYTDKIYGILHCRLFNFQDKKRWATATIIRIRSILKFYCCLWYLNALIETIKQQDGWKTQDGTRTKKCHARPGMHRLTRPIFVILPSWVSQPSCCIRSLMWTRWSWEGAKERFPQVGVRRHG